MCSFLIVCVLTICNVYVVVCVYDFYHLYLYRREVIAINKCLSVVTLLFFFFFQLHQSYNMFPLNSWQMRLSMNKVIDHYIHISYSIPWT